MVSSSPLEPHLQHEGLHQAELSAPGGRGSEPTTPKWAMLTDILTAGRTIAPLGSTSHTGRGDRKGHWLQHRVGLLQGKPCPMGQILHLEDLQHVMLSDPGMKAQDKLPMAIRIAAGR